MKKITAVFFAWALAAVLVAPAVAQEAAQEKKQPVGDIEIVIVEDSKYPQGKAFEGLTLGLAQYANMNPKVTTMTEKKARSNKKIKKIMDEHKLDVLPLYLLKKTKNVQEKFGEDVNKGYLRDAGEYYIVPPQTPEFVFTKRATKPNVLELFVMSQCPYGVMAENKIIEAYKAGKLPKDKQIKIRYIVSYNAENDTFQSLHGQAEWEEDARQLVIAKYFPEKFWDYMEIRNDMYQSKKWGWILAAKEVGLNPDEIERLMPEGKAMLKEEAKYGEGINSSPTFLWEGKVKVDTNSLSTKPGFEFFNPNANNGNAAPVPAGSC